MQAFSRTREYYRIRSKKRRADPAKKAEELKRKRELHKQKWDNDPEYRRKCREKDRRRRIDPEKRKKTAAARRQKYKTSSEYREKIRFAGLKKRYGIEREGYEKLEKAQNHFCASCAEFLVYPVLDHCHTTGKIRGILCGECNRALGHALECPNRLRNLADYIERYNA